MNVIIAYLETMFSAYPQTSRLQEAKAELQAMMEDAYTSLIAEGRAENEAVGQVIRDFGNLEEVAPVLGIASDIWGVTLLVDSRYQEGSTGVDVYESQEVHPGVQS